MEKAPMTLGYTDLETELKWLKSNERPDVIKAIVAAREHGDLSEMRNTMQHENGRRLSKVG